MLASYAVILRRSAVVTAPAALAMVVLSTILGGAKGLAGSLLGVALVITFFGISTVAVTRAARHSPQAMMVTAITTYFVKIVALLFFVARFSGTTAFNGKLFGLTAIVCVLTWTTAQVLVSARLKVPYVEPDGKRGPGAAARHPDGVSRPAVPACPGPGTGHDKRAHDDHQQARRAAGRRPEHRLDDLRLPDLGHARLRRARLA